MREVDTCHRTPLTTSNENTLKMEMVQILHASMCTIGLYPSHTDKADTRRTPNRPISWPFGQCFVVTIVIVVVLLKTDVDLFSVTEVFEYKSLYKSRIFTLVNALQNWHCHDHLLHFVSHVLPEYRLGQSTWYIKCKMQTCAAHWVIL